MAEDNGQQENSPEKLVETRVTRRRAISTGAAIGAAAVGVVVAGVAGYYVGGGMTPPSTKTVTQTVSGGGQTTTITSTQTVTASPTSSQAGAVRIGVPAHITGPFSTDGEQAVDGVKMAVDEINKAGWFMGGRDIQIFTADVGSVTPDEVKKAVEQLTYVNNVHVNINYWGTYGTGWDVTGKSGIPLLTGDSPKGLYDYMAKNPDLRVVNTWVPVTEDPPVALAALEWLIAQGLWKPHDSPPSIYIVRSDFVWDNDYTETLVNTAQTGNWKVVGNDLLPQGTADFSPVLAKIKQVNPDVVFHNNTFPADSGIFASQFTANPSKSLVWNDWGFSAPESIKMSDPNALNGVCWGPGGVAIQSPKKATFDAAFKDKFGIDATVGAYTTYDETYFALKAMNMVGSTDPAAVYSALYQVSLDGLRGKYVFNPATHGIFSYPEFVANKAMQIQMVNGKIDQFNGFYPPQVAWVNFQLPSWLK